MSYQGVGVGQDIKNRIAALPFLGTLETGGLSGTGTSGPGEVSAFFFQITRESRLSAFQYKMEQSGSSGVISWKIVAVDDYYSNAIGSSPAVFELASVDISGSAVGVNTINVNTRIPAGDYLAITGFATQGYIFAQSGATANPFTLVSNNGSAYSGGNFAARYVSGVTPTGFYATPWSGFIFQ